MRIIVKRSGGYAGLQRVADIDTSRLDAERAGRLERLVAEASAAASGGAEPIGADLMRYEITVEEGAGNTRSMSWIDDGRASPGPVKRLIDEVEQLSG